LSRDHGVMAHAARVTTLLAVSSAGTLTGGPGTGSDTAGAASDGQVTTNAAFAQAQEPILDITPVAGDAQVLGRLTTDVRADLAARYTSYGRSMTPEDVQLYEVYRPSGSSVIATTDPIDWSAFQPGVDRNLELASPSHGSAESTIDADAAPAAAPRWSLTPATCLSTLVSSPDGLATMNACWQRFRLEDDGTKSNDWHGIRVYATAFNAQRATLAVGRDECCPFPFDAWSDWSPRSDFEGPCEDRSYGISTPIGGLSWSTHSCETHSFEPIVDSNPGVYSMEYSSAASGENRELAFAIAGKVGEGEPYRRAAYCQSILNIFVGDSDANCASI
jgi:hypothetical protein